MTCKVVYESYNYNTVNFSKHMIVLLVGCIDISIKKAGDN